MFTKLTATNYRGFDNLSLDNLGLINVFTGLNGSGKTTALELPFLVGGAGNLNLVNTIEMLRRNSYGAGSENAFLSMFRDLNANEGPKLTAKFAGRDYNVQLSALPSDIPIPNATQTQSIGGVKMAFTDPNGDKHESTGMWVIEDSAGNGQTIAFKTVVNRAQDFLISGSFQSPYHYFETQTYRNITELVKTKAISSLVKDLKVLEPRLQNIVPIMDNNVQTIYVDIGDLNQLYPVSSLGSGFGNILSLLAIAANKPAFLCIDELEDGIHHSVRLPLVRNLIGVAKRDSIQLFITTHSNSLLFDLITAATELECADLAIYRMIRDTTDGRLKTNRFSLPEAQDALNADIDLR